MDRLKVDQQLENAQQAFNLLLVYFTAIVFTMANYFKLFSNWKAVAVIAPAFATYIYATKTLSKAIASTKESTE